MKQATLITLTFAFLTFGCNDNKSVASLQSENVNSELTETITLASGLEARTTQSAALWTENELKVLEGPNWVNAKSSSQLENGANVYVSNVGDKYAKVLTAIGTEGYIVKDLLQPISKDATDSVKYFKKKRIARINTYVDGMDVGTVKLWSDMESRNNVVGQLNKDDKVAILQEVGEYIKVATINGKEGWCMKGFVQK